jgi:hypothetical protein
MKKKSSLFFLIFIFSLISFTKVYSKQVCDLLLDDYKKNYTEYNLDTIPYSEINDFGFDLQKKFNIKSAINDPDIWIFDNNEEGYFKVGKIGDPDLIGKIFENDLIISANGKDLRKLNLEVYDKEIDAIFKDNEKVNFIFKNQSSLKNYNLEIKKNKKNVSMPFTDVYIKSIDIDEKNNKFNAGLELNFQYAYGFEKDDFDPIYEKALQYLLREDDIDGTKYTDVCSYTTEEWQSLKSTDPGLNFSFENIHSINQSLLEESYVLKPYSEDIPLDVELGWKNELTIDYFAKGIFSFNTDFDLRNFPFDKQKLVMYLVDRGQELDRELMIVSGYSKRVLNQFSDKNPINGWNIISNRLTYLPYKGPNDVNYYDGVKFEIEIERKHSYYLYKVIIPILLILMVCWSSLWVAPREIESRLTITIVCLLSLIAYNFVIDKELPKLEYLTILDWIILTSYVYATIPNFLSIYSHKLILNKKNAMCSKVESLGKKYGITSYFLIVLLIIAFNVNITPENASSLISWMG